MTLTMFDSFAATTIPANATVVAGYVDGGDYDELVARFPHATHFSITASQAPTPADCLDVERGDASVSQVAGWVHWMQKAGHYRPCVYASLSTMPQVSAALKDLPRNSYRLWVAAWQSTEPAGVPAGYDGVQWKTVFQQYDQSLLRTDFFAPAPPPPPKYPTLTPANKTALSAVREDLIGIIAQKGALTPPEFDQLKLAYQRIGAIPGVKG